MHFSKFTAVPSGRWQHQSSLGMTRDNPTSQMLVSMPGGVDEWGLIELQGQIETRDQISFSGMHVGDLHFSSKGVPSLIVGHHLLTGKITSLEKPYAILKKTANPAEGAERDSSGEGMDWDEHKEEHTSTTNTVSSCTSTNYKVVALITKKILFSNRPKPIITKTSIKK